jgi:pyruvate dehydrogenase E2 component (dihydrolipoamide acetyltransferase)
MSGNDKLSSYEVVMPRLGLTMTEGRIVEWFKNTGDLVEKGEPLFSIENEKATLDIESPFSGFVNILVAADIVVPILKPVALISKESVANFNREFVASVERGVISRPEVLPERDYENGSDDKFDTIKASPRARFLAKKLGIDLTKNSGTGVRGMIVEKDIKQVVQSAKAIKATPLAKRKAAESGIDLSEVNGSGPRGIIQREDVERHEKAEQTDLVAESIKPLSNLRSIIASRLGASWIERPQVTLTTEADATLFVEARKQMNTELEKKAIKLSYNTLLIKLSAMALVEHPYMNVSLLPEGLIQHQHANIGLAVDTEQGLMVPVVHNAAMKNHEELHYDLQGLVDRTLQGNYKSDDLIGGTFTITNLGTYDIDAFTPIINPPECAILGIGRIIEKPVVREGQVVVRQMMALSLSFDHRLVDGVPAARFLQRINQYIEQPFLWSLWDK